MSPAVFSLWILIPNRQVPKGVGTEMRAMVASWGLLLHNEGAWGAVGGCRGLFGRQFWGSRVQKKKFENFGEPSKRAKAAKSAPKCPPKRAKHEPKRAPKDVEEHLYRGNADLSNSNKSLGKIKVFEGRRVRLGGVNSTPRGSKIKKQVT